LVYESLLKVRHKPAGIIGVTGLELRVALLLLERGNEFKEADNDFWPGKCQKLLVRPAVEPIAISYWRRFATFDFDETIALILASTLAARRLVYRKGPATGRSAEGDVGFEPLEIASQWLARIAGAAARPELSTALPIYAYAQVLMAHPFADANGRFARLMIHVALARCAGLKLPAVALAPAFYRRASALGRTLTTLSDSGEWAPFNDLFLDVLEDAVFLTKALTRLSRG
jgi:hypothetical protein